MPLRPLRFDPPPVVIDSDLAWLLRSAFARQQSRTSPHDARRALELARATQLSGRVAARLGAWRGVSVGEISEELSADYFANVARETLLLRAHQQVAELAERLRIPVIAVKFGGLRLTGVVAQGARTVADLDLLLPHSGARQFWRALLAAGFQRTKSREYSHQLEALRDPYGAEVDLHLHLPGVIVERGSFASADQLIVHGLVHRTGTLLAPTAPILAAHAIVHALVQNRSTPQTYSPFRMLSDIIDLRQREPEVVQRAVSYLAPERRVTCEAVERLCLALSNGVFEGPTFDGTSEQLLLRHCVAARLDFDYAERLRAAGLTNKFEDGSSAIQIGRYVADLLYPAESALDVLYGPALDRWARVRRRLHRPLDLATRAVQRALRARGT